MDLVSREYQEKRSFIRMKVDTPVSIQLDEGPSVKGICRNLSGGGMYISLPESLPIGTRMEATVSSNHGHNPMLRALVQVNRIQNKPASSGQLCDMGLEIVELID